MDNEQETKTVIYTVRGSYHWARLIVEDVFTVHGVRLGIIGAGVVYWDLVYIGTLDQETHLGLNLYIRGWVAGWEASARRPYTSG